MKIAILHLLILMCLPLGSQSQTLVSGVKKKYFGQYVGEIPAYKFTSDTTSIVVDPVSLSVELTDGFVLKKVGRLEQKGVYNVLFKDKRYYVLELRFDMFPYVEKWMLKEKTKELIREGGMNQPAIRLRYRGK